MTRRLRYRLGAGAFASPRGKRHNRPNRHAIILHPAVVNDRRIVSTNVLSAPMSAFERGKSA
ncbi:hypothetical protein SBA7_1270014 [Candidatus Sulfotelmatobacter sp. SbA7]|nr:hypothetical protein SBA7_1270014 [Candidatus Sulfotelmatobacter sp. SbA7]